MEHGHYNEKWRQKHATALHREIHDYLADQLPWIFNNTDHEQDAKKLVNMVELFVAEKIAAVAGRPNYANIFKNILKAAKPGSSS